MLIARHRRKYDPNHFDAGRPNDDNEHARKNEEDERKEQFDRKLRRKLLGLEPTGRTHGIRVNPKRLADAGSEPVSLYEQGHQISYLFQIRTKREVSERFLSRDPG